MDDMKSRIINYIGRYIICPQFAVSGLKINKKEQVADLLSFGSVSGGFPDRCNVRFLHRSPRLSQA